jgi:regulatory protein
VKVEVIPSQELPQFLTLLVDGENWREVSVSIFGRKPEFLKDYPSLNELEAHFNELEFHQAKCYAFKILAARSLPSSKLKQYLERRQVSDLTIKATIAECQRLGFINDKEWIESFIRTQKMRKAGPQAIRMKLKAKGISSASFEKILENLDSAEERKERIQHLLTTRYRPRNLTDFRERNKVIASLVRRGFDISEILDVLK